MWVQNKMGTRLETALAQRSRRSFQNFWVTTGRLNFLWSNVHSDGPNCVSIRYGKFSKVFSCEQTEKNRVIILQFVPIKNRRW